MPHFSSLKTESTGYFSILVKKNVLAESVSLRERFAQFLVSVHFGEIIGNGRESFLLVSITKEHWVHLICVPHTESQYSNQVIFFHSTKL